MLQFVAGVCVLSECGESGRLRVSDSRIAHGSVRCERELTEERE